MCLNLTCKLDDDLLITTAPSQVYVMSLCSNLYGFCSSVRSYASLSVVLSTNLAKERNLFTNVSPVMYLRTTTHSLTQVISVLSSACTATNGALFHQLFSVHKQGSHSQVAHFGCFFLCLLYLCLTCDQLPDQLKIHLTHAEVAKFNIVCYY